MGLRRKYFAVAENCQQKLLGSGMDSWRGAAARARDVERLNVLQAEPEQEISQHSIFVSNIFVGCGEIDIEQRLPRFYRESLRESSAGGHCAPKENERAVGVLHVFLRADPVAARVGFLQLIFARDLAVFGEPAARAPAAVRNSQFHRGIERSAIDAGLSAGDDLGDRGG